MKQDEAIQLFIIMVVVSLLVRLMISNPIFGASVNKISAQIF
jgi:hypothetical protein